MENRTNLQEMGERLIEASRTELYLALRFMGPALMNLGLKMDLSAKNIGTDAAYIRYNSLAVMQICLEHPYILTRTVLHLVLHCIFRHMYGLGTHPDEELWDLCADIAVESVIDDMDCAAVMRTPSDFRTEWYSRLTKELRVLTAEKLYRYFEEHEPGYDLLIKLINEFRGDDHVFWPMINKDDPENSPGGMAGGGGEEMWKRAAKRVENELIRESRKAGREPGMLDRILSFELKERNTLRDVLSKFAVIREEVRVDPDSFDYGFYNYGMELFGNMPLIEENEYAESNRISELVIAIDTSASCSDEAVRHFLNETASVLLQKDRFFRNFELHIMECDAKVHGDLIIRDADEMRRYAENIVLKGGGGTDFRPVFAEVERLRKEGELRHMKGLMYFTDGLGRYPSSPPPYEVVFVLSGDDYEWERDIPGWVLKVYDSV